MFECWNTSCPNYAGAGVRLGVHEVARDRAGRLRCRTCGAYVRARPPEPDDTARGVAGAAGGAIVGWAVGGPPGALIGGVLGLLVAASGSRGK